MQFKPVIVPYKKGLRSANALKRSLGAKIRRPGYIPRINEVLINWGCSSNVVEWAYTLNQAEYVRRVVDKVSFFNNWGFNKPEHTCDINEAQQWINEGQTLVARTLTRASGGKGIYILNQDTDFVNAPLYTVYKKKKKEFRIHFFHGEPFHYQEKKKRHGVEIDHKIRNHTNGWVFCTEDVVVPDVVLNEAKAAMQTTFLIFGAVDVIWNEHYNTAYVLEVNTAPGLEGTTLEKYSEKFSTYTEERGEI